MQRAGYVQHSEAWGDDALPWAGALDLPVSPRGGGPGSVLAAMLDRPISLVASW